MVSCNLCAHVQDNNLAVAACAALSQVAYLAPDLVLPLVQSRFQVSLHLLKQHADNCTFLC